MNRSLILPLLLIALTAWSCGSDDQQVREEARESLANATAVNNPTANAAPAGPTTSIQFEDQEWSFGAATEGDIIEHVYSFTNTGKEPLLITNAKGSCGCTVPDYPKTPIAPGETGEVKVRLNTTGKKNNVRQSVTLTANTQPANTVIYISGQVNPKGTGQNGMQVTN